LPLLGNARRAGAFSSSEERRSEMVKKLETGEYLLERDREAAPPNKLRQRDNEAEARHEENKKTLFKKL
jgi:hypothetical protein